MLTLHFTKRNIQEASRAPISYIFTLVMPLAMLIFFQILNRFIPAENTFFNLANNLAGVLVFAYAFVSLYLAVLVAKDKSTSFLKRLIVSPMRRYDFLFGYALFGLILMTLQTATAILTSYILGWCLGIAAFANFGFCLLLFFSNLPIMLFFAMLGILFGTLLSEKAASPVTSITVSVSGILSGAWIPIEMMGTGFKIFCQALPFYSATLCNRVLLVSHQFTFMQFYMPLIISISYAIALTLGAFWALKIFIKK